MADYLRRGLDQRQARFVVSRVGEETLGPTARQTAPLPVAARTLRRLQSATLAMRRLVAGGCALVLLGPEGRAALREGTFRRSGEVHQWMYDRFSLVRALEAAGFTGVRVCGPDESEIAGFGRYGLETTNGQARKPDSLYVEGRKPRAA
jgi:hypothetical protein